MSSVKQKVLIEKTGLTKENVVLFADAIFSIAITLLVLEIKLPNMDFIDSNEMFIQGLVQTSPKLIGFAISFFVIALYWRGYHRIVQYLIRFNGTMLLLNIIFLFMIALMPFPTSLIGDYGNYSSVVNFYQIVMALTSIIMFIMWQYAARGNLLIDPGLDRRLVHLTSVRSLVPAAVFIATIPLAFYSPMMTELSWIAMAPLTYIAKKYYGVKDAKFFE
jgi:uncharacterized membrane protein